MDFLGAVNRVLVNNLIIKGDDDLVTTFSDNQHEATIRLARNAIESELNNLLSFFPIDYEKTSGTLTTVASQRSYSLPADFIRFYGDNPYMYLTSNESYRIYEYKGGEQQLRQVDFQYLSSEGYENYWYWDSTTTKKVALYNIPDAVREYTFDYEKDVSVTAATDTMPFHTAAEAQSFADMASRRFKYAITETLDVAQLEKDAEYNFARQTLFNLMAHKYPSKRYGKRYR